MIIRDKQTLVDLSDTTKHSISIAARDFVSKLIKTINSKSRAIKLFQNVSRLYLKITKSKLLNLIDYQSNVIENWQSEINN